MSGGGERSRVWLWVLGGAGGLLLILVCVGWNVVGLVSLFRNPTAVEREVVLAARCEGGELSFVLEATVNRVAGATTRTELVGEWRSRPSTATRTFPVDGEPPPVGAWPRHTLHGVGPEYVSFFLAAFSEEDAARIERCTEANAPALLGAIDAINARPSPAPEVPMGRGGPAVGRGRLYWRIGPEGFEPEFRDGPRALRLQRNGELWLEQPWSGGGTTRSLVGVVVAHAGEPPTFRCCEGGFDAQADLPRFRDSEARTVADLVGAPPMSCAVPNTTMVMCSHPSHERRAGQ